MTSDSAAGRDTSRPSFLTEDQAKLLLASYGILTPRESLSRSPDEAALLGERIGFPVVLKVVSPDVPHKTEAGGVRLNVRSAGEARSAYKDIVNSVGNHAPGARIDGVLVAEQISTEHELFCGMSRDPQFGPVIAFGLGGIFVEVLKDVAFGITPLLEVDALEMIRGIRGHAALAGARGRRPVDERQLAGTLLGLARLCAEHPEVEELDINPLAVTPDGRLVALDCLIKQGAPGGKA